MTYSAYFGKDLGEFSTFKEAFIPFWTELEKTFASGGISLQVIKTACWITAKDGERTLGPLMFYDVKDLAYEVGLLVDGGILNAEATVDESAVKIAYFTTAIGQVAEDRQQMVAVTTQLIDSLKGLQKVLPEAVPIALREELGDGIKKLEESVENVLKSAL